MITNCYIVGALAAVGDYVILETCQFVAVIATFELVSIQKLHAIAETTSFMLQKPV